MTTSRTGTAKWKALRSTLIKTRPHVCHWCRRDLDPKAAKGTLSAIEIDHAVPVAVAPELEYDETNLVLACYPCNRSKGKRDVVAGRSAPTYAIDINGGVIRDPSVVCKIHQPIKVSCPHSGSLKESA